MEKLLTPAECAERTGLSLDWIRQVLRSGELAHIRVGTAPAGHRDKRKYMVAPSDLEAWLQHKKETPRVVTVSDKTVDAWRKAGRQNGRYQSKNA